MNLNTPKPFIYDKNKKGADWIMWKRNFFIYLRLAEINRALKKEEKAFLLINLMGDCAQKASMTFSFEDKQDIDILIRKFDEIFIPAVNEIEERCIFFSRKKKDNESIDHYVVDLQKKAASCNFNNKANDFVRDMIILNMDKHLQKKALQRELSLQEVVILYKHSENIFKECNLPLNIQPGRSADTNDFSCKISNKESSTKSVCWRCSTSHPPRACPAWGKRCEDCHALHHFTENCNKEKLQTQSFFCKKCGTSHLYKQCPAFGVTCANCLKMNHLDSQCKNEKVSVANYSGNCDWCGSKHLPLECPHDETCSKCDNYPHNICFQCRENPHVHSCIFKELITLPLLNNEHKNSDVQGLKCAWCDTVHHPGARCPHDATCASCQNYPHKICFQCRENPHVRSCIFKELITLPLLNNEDKNSVVQGLKCAWCDTVHNPGAHCPHDAACTSCQHYPHKICFECRKNPHNELCLFKNLVKLPNC